MKSLGKIWSGLQTVPRLGLAKAHNIPMIIWNYITLDGYRLLTNRYLEIKEQIALKILVISNAVYARLWNGLNTGLERQQLVSVRNFLWIKYSYILVVDEFP